MKRRLGLVATVALLAMACGDDDKEQTLGGEPFTFVSGRAKIGVQDLLEITLAGYEEEDPCALGAYRELPYVWWLADNKTGRKELGFSETVVFQTVDDVFDDGSEDPGEISKNVTIGHFTIDSIGATVTGSVEAEGFDDYVNFSWEVPFCE